MKLTEDNVRKIALKTQFTDNPVDAFDAAWNRRVGDDLLERMVEEK